MSLGTFDQALDAFENLLPDEKEEFVELIRKRLAEQGRKRVIADVQQSRADFQAGNFTSSSVDELMKKIQS